MNWAELLKEAFTQIFSNRVRSLITISIIAIGLMALVAILTSIEAIKTKVQDSFGQLGANTFEIHPGLQRKLHKRQGAKVKHPPISYTEAQSFKQISGKIGIVSISRSVGNQFVVQFLHRKTNPNISMLGVEHSFIKAENLQISHGRFFTSAEIENAIPVCVLGSEIAVHLFIKGDAIGKKININHSAYRIIGTLSSLGHLMGGKSTDRQVLIPVNCARKITSIEPPSYQIKVKIFEHHALDQLIEEARERMRSIRKLKKNQSNNFEIDKGESIQNSLLEINGYLKIGGLCIGLITLLGSAIGLLNIMLVGVTERIPEIGLRKSIGASSADIQRLFLLEALLICFLGGLLGILLGIATGNWVAFLIGTNSFVMPWSTVGLAFTLCVCIGAMAGYQPAKKASKINPIEALRQENL